MREDNFVESVHSRSGPVVLHKPNLEVILTAVLQIYKLQETDLAASGQKRWHSEARAMTAWAALELSDATLTELSHRLKRDVPTLSTASRRFERIRHNDLECKKKFAELKTILNFGLVSEPRTDVDLTNVKQE